MERDSPDYLPALKDVGLGSLPETSAENLDDRIREIISPGGISKRDWMAVIRTAHKLGIPTTSTMMYGHIETALDGARHLELLRGIQKETGGITEFVSLSFIASGAPMVKKSIVPGISANVALARACLEARANDFGGTLMNESISTSAGAQHGEFLHPAELRSWIRSAGRIPMQCSLTYQTLRVFEQEPVEAEPSRDGDRFGSYAALIASPEFRFRDRN